MPCEHVLFPRPWVGVGASDSPITGLDSHRMQHPPMRLLVMVDVPASRLPLAVTL